MKIIGIVQCLGLAIGLSGLGCAATKDQFVLDPPEVPAGSPWGVWPVGSREILANRLSSTDESSRISAYEHIASHGALEEWHLLASHLEQPSLSLSPRAGLALARALCERESSPVPYDLLWQIAQRLSSVGDPSDPSRVLALETTLLTIARSNERRSLVDLARALGTSGMLSSAALTALQAFPPSPIEALLRPEIPRSAAFYRLQGLLGNPAAVGELRSVLLSGPQESRFAAAESLLRFGDVDARQLVLSWKDDPLAPPQYREFSEQAIVVSAAEKGELRLPSNVHLNIPECIALTEASGSDRGATLLATTASLRQGLSSQEPLSRWCATVTLGLTAPVQLLPELARRDAAFENALGWLIPQIAESSPLTHIAEAELARGGGPPVAPWAYGSLVHDGIRFRRSERFFLALAHSQGPAAPLGAEGLAERMTATLTPTVRHLLHDENPLIRAATAKGLLRSNLLSATSMLVNRYSLETSALVRRSLIFALASRRNGRAFSLLARAAKCDPDPYVRRFASAQRPEADPESEGSRRHGGTSPWHLVTGPNAPLEARSPQERLSKPQWLQAVPGAGPTPTAVRITDVTGRTVTLPLAPGSLLYLLFPEQPLELSAFGGTTENPSTGAVKERSAAEWPSD